MTVWICAACGIEHEDAARPPGRCEICLDERQFVPATGQAWTTAQRLAHAGTAAVVAEGRPGLYRLIVTPQFAIGQQSLLAVTRGGNVLWDPSGFIDEASVDAVTGLGGVAAVALSHPHMLGAAVTWAQKFDAPLYVARADAEWIRRPDPHIRLWSDTAELPGGVRLVQCGGHFDGSAVAHWRDALLTGDTIFPGPRGVSAMRSYPNLIPLPASAIETILRRLSGLSYDALYGAFGNDLVGGAGPAVRESLGRYIDWVIGNAIA